MKKQIGEHIIDIPEYVPGMDLINEGESDENSYWKVPETPKIVLGIDENTRQYAEKTIWDKNEEKLISISQEDSITVRKFLEQDYYRRKNGVHMKNRDKIIWISPNYYFVLRWFKQNDIPISKKPSQLADFRLVQNDIMQLYDAHVLKDKDIAGLIIPKIKKSGITYLFAGAYLNEMTINRNMVMKAMSKDFDTAKQSIMAFIKYGLDNLPWVLCPTVSKSNVSEIEFSKPANNSKQTKKNNYLNNNFRITKTKTAAFDGPVPIRAWIDEFPKVWKASKIKLDELFKKSLESVKFQTVINGKLLLTSYMPEEADSGYYDAIKICNDSLINTIPEGSRRTRSNLILHPLYGYESHPECFNKYGECNQDKARQLILAERKTKVTPTDLIAHKRQYPLDWNDMFGNIGADAAFDNYRIVPRHDELKIRDQQGIRDYKEGNLRWEVSSWEEGKRPEKQFCKVYFEELTPKQIANGEVGSIKIFHDLEEIPALRHLLNKYPEHKKNRNGLPCPDDNSTCISSIDPVDYKIASDVRQGSKNGSFGGFIQDLNMDNIAEKAITNTPLFEYNYRHEDPDRILEDMIKICIYWDSYMIIEGNKGWLYTEFKNHGLQNYLLVKQANGTITPWQDYKELHGGNKMINTDEQMISIYMRAISRYIAAPKLGGIDYLQIFNSKDCLKQLEEFDPLNTKRFDLAVALGYWRVGIESLSIYRDNKTIQTDDISEEERARLLNNLASILKK